LNQTNQRRINDRAAFFWIVAGLVLAKMWLTSDIRIIPFWLPHDAENYVQHARDILGGGWFGVYNDLTLIKEPFYPIYLAFVQETGLTLPLANLLLYAVASLVACLAIRPLVRNGLILGAVFAVLFFNPATYASQAWTAMRSSLNESLALLATACALAIFVRRHAPFRALAKWWIGLGASFAAFWLTREEAIWLVPCLAVILAAYVASIRKDPNLGVKLLGLAIPFAFWNLSDTAVARLNQHFYGWNVVVETKAPEFVSAYNALARIDSGNHNPLVVVPHASREIAYRVSPAARELEPALEGPLGHNWINMVCKYGIHICDDFAGSFFVWAFRDSVAQAGHYTTGTEARNFYLRLASELDRACDSGEIRCRPKGLSIFPNPKLAELPQILAQFRDGVQMETTFSLFGLGHQVVPPNPGVDELYAFVVRSLTVDLRSFTGWLTTDHPMRISVEGPNGEKENIEGGLRDPSPDVAAVIGKGNRATWDLRSARFSFATSCVDECFIVAADADNHETKIPLTPGTINFSSPHVLYHLDRVDGSFKNYDEALKQGILSTTIRIYQTLAPVWVIAGAMVLLLRIVRAALRRRRTMPSANDALSIGVMAGGGLLILVLAALTVSYSAGFNAEYLESFVPLMLFALSAATAREGLIAYRYARPRLRQRSVREVRA